MKLADYPRSLNRARINSLFNGEPPYTEEERIQNRNSINVNCNDLSGTHMDMSARGQFGNAMVTPDPVINIELDYGPVWKKREWGALITREINKKIKQSLDWQEEEESTFAQVVLHGVGPANWQDRYSWCPDARGIEDIMVPSDTLRSLKNLPFVAVFRSYTAAELIKLTSGPHVDPAWNMGMVKNALDWVEKEAVRLAGNSWPRVWSPEKNVEFRKENSGLYMSNRVATIDTYDFYFWDDSKKKQGWRRRVILDMWGDPGPGGVGGVTMNKVAGKYGVTDNGDFLYDSKDRVYAEDKNQFLHFQFGDASAVAPFRYHSVRSLGFLLYAVCHLQNRLKCKFHDHVFENLIQYLRVANPAEAERMNKVDLSDLKVLPDGLSFVKQEERWQVNEGVIQMGLEMNRQTMQENSSSFTSDFDFEKEKTEETATRTMAKVNSTAALIGSMLNRAYNYQKFKLTEICRRFCIKDSKDPDVRSFRVECLKAGVPVEALNVERWNVAPVRVIGNGNRTLQVAMMDKIMATVYDKVDPDAQKDLVRSFIAVNSGDYDLANRSVPEQRPISDSKADAGKWIGTILAGLPATVQDGMNHSEYVEVWMHALALRVQMIEQKGGMATPDELMGLNNLAMMIQQQIALVARDKNEKARVKKYGDDLKNLTNMLKGYAQRLAEQAKKQAAQAQPDPAAQAKIQTMTMAAETKAKLAADSHAQKTAQRQIAFEQQLKQKHEQHQMDTVHDSVEHRMNLKKTNLEAASAVNRNKMKSLSE